MKNVELKCFQSMSVWFKVIFIVLGNHSCLFLWPGFYPTLTNDKKQKYLSSADEQKTLRFYTVQTFMEVTNGMMK